MLSKNINKDLFRMFIRVLRFGVKIPWRLINMRIWLNSKWGNAVFSCMEVLGQTRIHRWFRTSPPKLNDPLKKLNDFLTVLGGYSLCDVIMIGNKPRILGDFWINGHLKTLPYKASVMKNDKNLSVYRWCQSVFCTQMFQFCCFLLIFKTRKSSAPCSFPKINFNFECRIQNSNPNSVYSINVY